MIIVLCGSIENGGGFIMSALSKVFGFDVTNGREIEDEKAYEDFSSKYEANKIIDMFSDEVYYNNLYICVQPVGDNDEKIEPIEVLTCPYDRECRHCNNRVWCGTHAGLTSGRNDDNDATPISVLVKVNKSMSLEQFQKMLDDWDPWFSKNCVKNLRISEVAFAPALFNQWVESNGCMQDIRMLIYHGKFVVTRGL